MNPVAGTYVDEHYMLRPESSTELAPKQIRKYKKTLEDWESFI